MQQSHGCVRPRLMSIALYCYAGMVSPLHSPAEYVAGHTGCVSMLELCSVGRRRDNIPATMLSDC